MAWHKESKRHSLARRGVKTGKKVKTEQLTLDLQPVEETKKVEKKWEGRVIEAPKPPKPKLGQKVKSKAGETAGGEIYKTITDTFRDSADQEKKYHKEDWSWKDPPEEKKGHWKKDEFKEEFGELPRDIDGTILEGPYGTADVIVNGKRTKAIVGFHPEDGNPVIAGAAREPIKKSHGMWSPEKRWHYKTKDGEVVVVVPNYQAAKMPPVKSVRYPRMDIDYLKWKKQASKAQRKKEEMHDAIKKEKKKEKKRRKGVIKELKEQRRYD